MGRLSVTAAGLAPALLAAACGGGGADAPPPAGPNVLLIVTDQHNRRMVGCSGGSEVRTPHLDRLAAQGVRFTGAITPDPVCAPARYSLFTGLYPSEHGAFENGVRPRPDLAYLPAILAAGGWRTASVGKTHFTPPDETHGFAVMRHHEGYLGPARISHYAPWLVRELRRRGIPLQPNPGEAPGAERAVDSLIGTNPYPADLSPENWVTDHALRQVRAARDAGRPFFVHASYFAPHHPYAPRPEFLELYADLDPELPPSFHAADEQRHWMLMAEPYLTFEESEWKEILRHYYAYVSQVDEAIGRLLDGLDELGVAEDTLVLMVADHGDLMGEFRNLTKGFPQEGSIGVPFLARWPARFGPRVSDAAVSLVDVMPTVLDACGLAAPAGLRGRSLLPHLEGRDGLAGRIAFSMDLRTPPFRLLVARDERWKLVRLRAPAAVGPRSPVRAYLIDLASDPWELENRLHDPAAADDRARLEAALDDLWRREREHVPAVLPEPEPFPRYELEIVD